jgi:hypothetical protein
MITTLYPAVLEGGGVLGTVEPSRIKAEIARANRKDKHLKAALAKQHAHPGAMTVHIVTMKMPRSMLAIPLAVLPALPGPVAHRRWATA